MWTIKVFRQSWGHTFSFLLKALTPSVALSFLLIFIKSRLVFQTLKSAGKTKCSESCQHRQNSPKCFPRFLKLWNESYFRDPRIIKKYETFFMYDQIGFTSQRNPLPKNSITKGLIIYFFTLFFPSTLVRLNKFGDISDR